jgi:putative FmdB family regulatory protein
VPTYSYRCTECDNAFDIQQAFTDDTLTVCPVCGGKLRKVFSPVGVTFSGSGFYRTDSRAKAETSSAPATPQKDAAKPAAPAPSTSSSSGSSSS